MTMSFHPDKDMLYRYTQKALPPEEEEKVEIWLMENPSVLDRLELDELIAEHSESLLINTTIEKTVNPSKDNRNKYSRPPGWLHWAAPPIFQVSISFVLLASFSFVFYLYSTQLERNNLLTTNLAALEYPTSNLVEHTITAMRSGDLEQTIELPKDKANGMLLINIPVNKWSNLYQEFNVRLDFKEKQYTLQNLTPNWSNQLRVFIPLALATNKSFILTIYKNKEVGEKILEQHSIEVI